MSTEESKNWYDKKYKILLLIPIIILALSIAYLINFNSTEGDFIRKDVTLTGRILFCHLKKGYCSKKDLNQKLF